ncbi:methyltransferase domain-containing protein [Sphingomonas naphthae]|uniref:Methyltransferase domain-containing protein n=1 Tax=Sphingomonas naphthae TaxID=1813468 RepID=A0ABY7TU28_9SPHN|nr:methyltransferase domain-containing protein [Sphingomonas naphthae]WCT75369.1 methyltransferase domain-containing protein [Sphingomonas naphthae]
MLLSLGACAKAEAEGERETFPAPDRPVSAIVSNKWATEQARDDLGEARAVMDAAGVTPGMTVADLGAGEGYYTVRLAERVGAHGRVLAEDIVPAYRDRLAERVSRDRLDTVSVRLGLPADPRLPPASFDRIFMIHMYHEVSSPYEFLWRTRPALKPEGQLVVVDIDEATGRHGTPPKLLDCEMAAVGYARVRHVRLKGRDAYLSLYRAAGPRPAPAAIKACRA